MSAIALSHAHSDNVVDMFSGLTFAQLAKRKIIRIAPELDGIEMIYENELNPEDAFGIPILAWALQENGDVHGIVPWLEDIVACPDLSDPMEGRWVGYYNPRTEEIFDEVPFHKLIELESAYQYYAVDDLPADAVIQQIPDHLGTHAVLGQEDTDELTLVEVIGWQLLADGSLQALAADLDAVTKTPIMLNDPCLYPVNTRPDFMYFFQHVMANKIKQEDPEAMAALAALLGC